MNVAEWLAASARLRPKNNYGKVLETELRAMMRKM
jgi:hypothetical protein